MTTKKSFKKKISLKIIVSCLATALIAGVICWTIFCREQRLPIEFQKGMGYAAWSGDEYAGKDSDKSLERLRELGTDWVSILVTWYQTTPWSGDIQRTERTPSDDSIIYAIRKAHMLGMKVMLKPHLDLLDKSDGSWRGEIGAADEEGWEKWFSKYEEYLMHYVNMAKKEKVEMICVGTELSVSASVKGYMWRDLIKKIKRKYSGRLTYAAHWDRYLDIRFWDVLDYVGINMYFPLTEKIVPTYDELKKGLDKWITEIEEFQQRVNKPVIFTEIGCSSADGSIIRPWEHITRTAVNLKLQEDYYKVFFDTFWDKDWFYGFYWWYWGTNVDMGGSYNRGFSPQNKPAEQVVKEWYSKSDFAAAKSDW